MDLHWRGRKIDIVSEVTSCQQSRPSVTSANKVIFLGAPPAFERRRFDGLFDRSNILMISFWARGGGQFHIASDMDVWQIRVWFLTLKSAKGVF